MRDPDELMSRDICVAIEILFDCRSDRIARYLRDRLCNTPYRIERGRKFRYRAVAKALEAVIEHSLNWTVLPSLEFTRDHRFSMIDEMMAVQEVADLLNVELCKVDVFCHANVKTSLATERASYILKSSLMLLLAGSLNDPLGNVECM